MRKVIATAAQEMKLQVSSLDAQDLHEIERALAKAKQSGADAAIFAVDGFFIQVRSEIAAFALRHKLPTMFTQREHVVAGGMISYGPSLSAQYRRAAYYVDRILKGAKVVELPVEQPNVFELVVNLKTATALGLTRAIDDDYRDACAPERRGWTRLGRRHAHASVGREEGIRLGRRTTPPAS